MEAATRKGSITEEDVSLLLRRYSFTTILALLHEVAQFPGVKIDWTTLVKKTSTGISNAREYQMLWRHLAYRHALEEKLEEGSEPLDEDSDLEFEVEAFPAVSSEVSTEAAACVKVLIASGMPSNSFSPNSMVEAPLTINIPKDNRAQCGLPEGQHHALSTQGLNITIPVSVQKQPLPAVSSGEGLDCNGALTACQPARRKRKLWTDEEDLELIAAVQKCGEGNWANILKGDFKHARTASQLSQRWAIIRKRQANLNLTAVGSSTNPALSDVQLATRQAVSMALNMPMANNLSSMSPFGMPASAQQAEPGSKLEATQQATQPSQPTSTSPSSQKPAPPQGAKVRPTPKKSSAQLKTPSGPTPNPLVQAAAVAAGARIAPPSTAASVLKAAQSRNAVHIGPRGVPLPNPMLPASKPLGLNAISSRPSNVHYIRTGLASSRPVFSATVPAIQRSAGSARAVTTNQPSVPGAPPSTMLPGQAVHETSKSANLPNVASESSDLENMSQVVGEEHVAATKSENLLQGQISSSPQQSYPLNSEAREDQAEFDDSNLAETLEEEKVDVNNINHDVENVEKHADDVSS